MNIWLILITSLNILLLAGLVLSLFLKIKEKQEDQRITKGLQLLQNKLSILDDRSILCEISRVCFDFDSMINLSPSLYFFIPLKLFTPSCTKGPLLKGSI